MQLSGHHILIVEDEVLIAMDLADIVRDAGAKVVGPATSIDQALAFLERETVTAAVLDVNMGDHVSLAVATRLRSDCIPFIYHSGQFNELSSAPWPVAPIVSKPASADTLLARLIEVVTKDNENSSTSRRSDN